MENQENEFYSALITVTEALERLTNAFMGDERWNGTELKNFAEEALYEANQALGE